MAQTTIRIGEELHADLRKAAYEKGKTDKNWSMNKEIILRLESYNDLVKQISNLIESTGK
jgi:hypothetical protein